MKEKIFWAGILIIILSYIGNYLYFQSKQLDAPIFLEHFYELTMNEDDETALAFYYLTNKSDPSYVNFVRIDGVEAYADSNVGFMWESQAPQFEQEYIHHYLKSVYVSLPTEFEGDGPLSFSEMEVHLSDGKTVQANIGKVILHKSTENPNVLETRISSGSNQHREEESMVALQPITIEKIEFPFADELSDDILMKVDLEQDRLNELEKLMTGANPPTWFDEERDKEWSDLPGVLLNEDLLPLHLKQNEWIRFLMQFNPERDSYFQFSIKLFGKTKSGEKFVRELPIIDYPYLDQEAINRIIKAKESGENNEF
ncbi:hypothetical protein RGU12_19585 [Fredinandcohnia sp. QZ13]|uniref:hypothetical protein n=1 Tax=Fredinandcohnia sp. QZ13 TaxID=3073144 RepID=UPI0028534CF6|nr:hypothetical protein [Fredinandcohnia sp. QZ13]MDR4889700.1 hypothetical protein [Fredinandcohnia sp. QZ13]